MNGESVDLDAIIAAEATSDPRPVKAGEHAWSVLPELPWWFARESGDDPRAALAKLVVDGDPDEFARAMLADNPTWDRLYARVRAIYGMGESEASQRSSTNGSKRSRPTSSASTAST